MQKKIIRMISGSKRDDSTDPLFLKLEVLKVKEVYVYSLQFILFKFHHGSLPDIFTNFFTVNSSIHDHATRQANLLHVPVKKSKQASVTVRKQGVRSYNHYYNKIDLDCSVACYKRQLKQHILKNGAEFIDVKNV